MGEQNFSGETTMENWERHEKILSLLCFPTQPNIGEASIFTALVASVRVWNSPPQKFGEDFCKRLIATRSSWKLKLKRVSIPAFGLQAAAARLNAGLSQVTLTFLAKSTIRLLFFLSRLLSRLIDTFPRISIVWNLIFAHCLASTIVEVFASEQAESESSLYALFLS